MNPARRGFLKLIGMAPAAAPFAAQAVAQQNATGALRGLAWGASVAPEPGWGGDNPNPAWVRSGLGKLVWKAINKEKQEKEERFERNISYRFGAFDGDIAAMKSWSPSFAVSQQRAKDETHAHQMKALRGRLWPSDDE